MLASSQVVFDSCPLAWANRQRNQKLLELPPQPENYPFKKVVKLPANANPIWPTITQLQQTQRKNKSVHHEDQRNL